MSKYGGCNLYELRRIDYTTKEKKKSFKGPICIYLSRTKIQ